MKKSGLGILVTFIVALIFEQVGLWQVMAIAGISGGIVVRRSWPAFLVGFSGVFMGWLAILIYSEIKHQVIPLMKLTAQVFMLPEQLSFLLFLGVLLMGGIIGGLGGLTGWWWKSVFVKN